MKRGGVTALFLAACAVAGLLAAIALTAAPVGGADTGTTGTDTTATTAPPTETAPTTTAPRALTIATGVTVGRAPVGGLAPEAARAQLRRLFSRPLKLKLPARTITVTPQELGAAAYVGDALERARVVRPGANVPLSVKVNPASIERYVRALARRVDRAPVDSRLLLRKLKPYVTPGAPGRRLKQVLATRSIALALKTHDRGPVELRFDELEQKESRATIGDVIVIRRGQNRLYFYDGMHLVRAFNVATGQSRYPTPLGRYEVVVKWKNPWWYPPPDSPWAKGAKAIPPGPGNPLGTRWLGLSAPLVGIHGTPNDASIGYSQSHGCIRMHIPEAEWLFGQVDIGTPVYIVAP